VRFQCTLVRTGEQRANGPVCRDLTLFALHEFAPQLSHANGASTVGDPALGCGDRKTWDAHSASRSFGEERLASFLGARGLAWSAMGPQRYADRKPATINARGIAAMRFGTLSVLAEQGKLKPTRGACRLTILLGYVRNDSLPSVEKARKGSG
jgi:hypothetical protein